MRKRENNKFEFLKSSKELKLVLYIVLIVATYFIANKSVNFLLTLDVDFLKRSFNLILIAVMVKYVNKKIA